MSGDTIATFNERRQAEPLRARLKESGIPAEIKDESAMERLWFVSRPLAGVRLKVGSRDYEKAVGLLHTWDVTEGVLHDAVRCPECGSSRVEYPQHTKKFFLPNVLGLLAAMHLLERAFYCEDCHCTWPREGARRPRTRPHMAPYYFIEGVPEPDAESAEPQKKAGSVRK